MNFNTRQFLLLSSAINGYEMSKESSNKKNSSAQSHRTPSNSHSQTSNHGSSRVFIQDSKRSQSRPIQSETQQRWHKVESTTPIYLTGASLKGEIKSELGHSKEDKELRQAISAILNNQAPNGVIIDDNWTKLLVLKRPGAINARSRCIFSRECRIERILPIQLYKLTVDKKYVDDLKSCLQYRPGLFWRGVALFRDSEGVHCEATSLYKDASFNPEI